MPGKATAPSKPSLGTTSRGVRVKRREEKGRKRGSSLLEKWLQGFGNEDKNLCKVEEGKEKVGDMTNLGQKVGVLRKRFEEGMGAASSKEELQGRDKDPALGRDPEKEVICKNNSGLNP